MRVCVCGCVCVCRKCAQLEPAFMAIRAFDCPVSERQQFAASAQWHRNAGQFADVGFVQQQTEKFASRIGRANSAEVRYIHICVDWHKTKLQKYILIFLICIIKSHNRELLLNNNLLRVLPFEIGKLFQLHILGIHGNPLGKDILSIYNEVNGTSKLLTYMLDSLSSKCNFHITIFGLLSGVSQWLPSYFAKMASCWRNQRAFKYNLNLTAIAMA